MILMRDLYKNHKIYNNPHSTVVDVVYSGGKDVNPAKEQMIH